MWSTPTSHPSGKPTRFIILALIIISLLSLAVVGVTWSASQSQPDQTAFQWIYLRDGKSLAPGENLVELVAVGDVMLGRGVGDQPDVFSGVTTLLRSADLALGNFEGAIPDTSIDVPDVPLDPGYESYRLLVPKGSVSQLQMVGFDIMSLANNHALDGGEDGLAYTVEELKKGGITTLGQGSYTEATMPETIRQVNGVTVAFLAYNFIPPPQELNGYQFTTSGTLRISENSFQMEAVVEKIKTDIHRVRSQAETVIVLVHWGREFQLDLDPNQRELAGEMTQAGADVVLGTHPHVVQDVEIRHGGSENGVGRTQLIAYSLGNFVFDQGQEGSAQGLALRFFLDEDGLRAVQTMPVWAGPRPRWMEPEEASALLHRIVNPPVRQGFTCTEESCQPVKIAQEQITGLFWSGQGDLTGDGLPEKIRREAERVAIYQDERQVWQSPPEWRVVDLAVGDPNNDGRTELLLAIYKSLPEGGESSHPFIIGYRGGTYRVLWGGSAVSDPILEVELGDVNGDGVQELVALEDHGPSDQRTISVWRWHGWGFSLLWRSPTGPFRDLALIPRVEVGAKLISSSWECWQGLNWICPDYRILTKPTLGE